MREHLDQFAETEIGSFITQAIVVMLLAFFSAAVYQFGRLTERSKLKHPTPAIEVLDREQLKELMTMYMDIVKTLLSLVTLVAGGVVTLYLQTDKTKTTWFAFAAGVILMGVFLYVMALALNKWAIYTVNYKKAKPTGR